MSTGKCSFRDYGWDVPAPRTRRRPDACLRHPKTDNGNRSIPVIETRRYRAQASRATRTPTRVTSSFGCKVARPPTKRAWRVEPQVGDVLALVASSKLSSSGSSQCARATVTASEHTRTPACRHGMSGTTHRDSGREPHPSLHESNSATGALRSEAYRVPRKQVLLHALRKSIETPRGSRRGLQGG